MNHSWHQRLFMRMFVVAGTCSVVFAGVWLISASFAEPGRTFAQDLAPVEAAPAVRTEPAVASPEKATTATATTTRIEPSPLSVDPEDLPRPISMAEAIERAQKS